MSDYLLIVDDEEDLRENLVDALELQGYQVEAVSNGKEALELLQRSPRPCLIVLDLIMPVMDGWTFLDQLSSRGLMNDVPVLVSTSVPEQAPKGTQVMAKPIDLRRFLRTVESYCSRGDSTAR